MLFQFSPVRPTNLFVYLWKLQFIEIRVMEVQIYNIINRQIVQVKKIMIYYNFIWLMAIGKSSPIGYFYSKIICWPFSSCCPLAVTDKFWRHTSYISWNCNRVYIMWWSVVIHNTFGSQILWSNQDHRKMFRTTVSGKHMLSDFSLFIKIFCSTICIIYKFCYF